MVSAKVIDFPARPIPAPAPEPAKESPYAITSTIGAVCIVMPPESWMSWQGALEFAREVIRAAAEAKDLETEARRGNK